MREYHFWTYITTNPERNVMYTGVTNNLAQRLKEHYENRGDDKTFAGKYYCYCLIYYEYHKYIRNAIEREKQIKDLSRAKKMNMISEANPDWKFLNLEICEVWPPRFDGRLPEKEIASEADWWLGLTLPPE